MALFRHRSAARRYAASRPYFHPLVITRIRDYLNLREPLPLVLDVACGTGQSMTALTEIARHIVGIDISQGMLAEAPCDERFSYAMSRAERLPFAAHQFDLVTVALAFHWFDQAAFLEEAARVLKPGGWLIIYNNVFSGQMLENPAYKQWSRGTYLARFPTPRRRNVPLSDEDAASHGFRFAQRETYTNLVRHTPEQHAAYLTTQSNVIAAVEEGALTEEEAYSDLLSQVRPLFQASEGMFQFGGTIWFLQREML